MKFIVSSLAAVMLLLATVPAHPATKCSCPKPPGGSVMCPDKQNAHCQVKDGQCATSCSGITRGEITEVDITAGKFTLKEGDSFVVSDATKILSTGKSATLGDLKVGDSVSVSFTKRGDTSEATRIVVAAVSHKG
jgi:Cu/Ag efflux protein CusF